MGCRYHVVLTHNHLNTDVRFAQPLAGDTQTTVEYTLPIENLHAVMRRLAACGAARRRASYVAGDLLDLAMLSVARCRPRRHPDPARRSRVLLRPGGQARSRRSRLRRLQPADVRTAARASAAPRREHPPPALRHSAAGAGAPRRRGTARVRFLPGRLEHGQKGVLELPAIDRPGCATGRLMSTWTIIGDGPDGAKRRWRGPSRMVR